MTLAQQMKQDSRIFLNSAEHAEIINYRPASGPPNTDIPAIIDDVFDVDLGQLVDTTLTVLIGGTGITDVPGITNPVAGDRALLRGRVCRLIERPRFYDQTGCWECKFEVGPIE